VIPDFGTRKIFRYCKRVALHQEMFAGTNSIEAAIAKNRPENI
jgi:hypothetical protein